VARERGPGAGGGSPGAPDGALPPRWQATVQRLEKRLGTRVTLVLRPDGESGRIGIEFYSLDDFNRLYDLLKGR
jgi:hypothetical protein